MHVSTPSSFVIQNPFHINFFIENEKIHAFGSLIFFSLWDLIYAIFCSQTTKNPFILQTLSAMLAFSNQHCLQCLTIHSIDDETLIHIERVYTDDFISDDEGEVDR